MNATHINGVAMRYDGFGRERSRFQHPHPAETHFTCLEAATAGAFVQGFQRID